MRIPRKNDELNDAIELLDQYYIAADKNEQDAWSRLSSDELGWIDTELERILDLRYYLENYHVIKTEHGVLKTLYPFWDHQEILYGVIQEEWEANGYCKIIVLKPRQTGISVWTAASMFHRTITTPHCFTMIVAQNGDTSTHLYNMSLNAYYNLPWWMRPEYLYKTKTGAIEFQRRDEKERTVDQGLGSVIQVSPANQTTGVAIGRSIRCLHGCLTENNTIINEHGMAISIADAACGTRVFTGEGYPALISAYSKREARSIYPGAENGYKITPWCSSAFPLEGTGNHKVLACPIYVLKHRENGKQITERTHGELEMTPFHKLKERWYGVALPVPEITSHGNIPGEEERPKRPQGGGKMSHWIPPEPSHEFGFAVGLYLAEGNATGRRLVITLDRDEQDLADRFAKAIGVAYKKKPKENSRTVWYLFERAALRDWFANNVGHLDKKRIQQWMWNVGREFLSGLLEGMILGDGHVSPACHRIQISPIREQLAISLRWVAAALGHGWADVRSRAAGFHYGRNCQKIWTLGFCQKTDASIRAEYGLKRCANKKQRNASHWMYTFDKKHIICPIRTIERVHLEYVYDIEVQNSGHTYLLPSAQTHNSEVSRWSSDEVYEADIKPSMNARDTYAVLESTGYGRQGLFYEQWSASVDGDTDFRHLFIPVYKVRKYYLPIKGAFDLAEEEQTFNERIAKEEHFAIPEEFWNFRRRGLRAAKRGGNKAGFLESYPLTPAEAFQSSGLCAFDRDSLEYQSLNYIRRPEFIGEIRLISMEGARIDTSQIVAVEDNTEIPRRKSGRGGNRFFIWEMPERGVTYYLGVDVALGNGGDFSVCEVFRAGQGLEPDTQVAEWWGWIPPKKFAHVVAAIGIFYNMAEMAVEYMKDGITTGNELRDIDYPHLYRPQFKDRLTHQASNYLHWLTTSKTRDEIIGTMNEALLDRVSLGGRSVCTVIIRSADLLDEMIDFAAIDIGGKTEGQGNNDDGVMSSMICLYCLRETCKHLKNQAVQDDRDREGGASYVYGVYDNFMRQRGQYGVEAEARKVAGTQPGWTVRPIQVCNANTLYSPIFDAMGAESELYQKHGMHSTEITPEVVWAYRQAMRNYSGTVNGSGDDWL